MLIEITLGSHCLEAENESIWPLGAWNIRQQSDGGKASIPSDAKGPKRESVLIYGVCVPTLEQTYEWK